MQIKRPVSLGKMAEDRIRTGIVRGEFQLGESLQENRLSASFGISKTPIREALAALGRQGLVEFFPNRGAFVFTLDQEEARQLCRYRLMLENRALELSNTLDHDGLVDALETVCEEMSAALNGDAFDRYLDLDTEFHDAFFDFCGNKYLRAGYRQISDVVATMRTHLSKRPDRTDMSYREHRAVLEHVREGDLSAARSVLERHVTRGERSYIDLVGERQGADGTTGSGRA